MAGTRDAVLDRSANPDAAIDSLASAETGYEDVTATTAVAYVESGGAPSSKDRELLLVSARSDRPPTTALASTSGTWSRQPCFDGISAIEHMVRTPSRTVSAAIPSSCCALASEWATPATADGVAGFPPGGLGSYALNTSAATPRRDWPCNPFGQLRRARPVRRRTSWTTTARCHRRSRAASRRRSGCSTSSPSPPRSPRFGCTSRFWITPRRTSSARATTTRSSWERSWSCC